MTIDPRLHRIVAAQPYPLLFATISGAHLYGFPSPDSDYDLREARMCCRSTRLWAGTAGRSVKEQLIVPGKSHGR
jgi:predicted nucleotidyltransferase